VLRTRRGGDSVSAPNRHGTGDGQVFFYLILFFISASFWYETGDGQGTQIGAALAGCDFFFCSISASCGARQVMAKVRKSEPLSQDVLATLEAQILKSH
jgi:hypothetical protein